MGDYGGSDLPVAICLIGNRDREVAPTDINRGAVTSCVES
jgi:hypothetical protein